MVRRAYSRTESEHLLDEAWGALRTWLAVLDPARYDDASVLAGWTVRDLVAHCARALDAVTALEPATRATAGASLADYLAGYNAAPGDAERISRITRELADATRNDPLGAVDAAYAAARHALDDLPIATTVVVGRRGPVRLPDFVLSRVLEVVVHGDDLARSVDLPGPAQPRDVVRAVVRVLLDALAERAPGNSVEVRVPPFAAVQCIAGPRHTRGTPPNVVETEAWTWIRLATGRVDWAEAVAARPAMATGPRADLSGVLPLL